jgi:hypothetical protein
MLKSIVDQLGGWFNIVAGAIISVLYCAAWISHDVWLLWIWYSIMGTLLAVAALADLAKISIHGKATKILARGVAIVVIVLMAVIWHLHEVELAEERQIPDYLLSWGYDPKIKYGECRDECNKYYGFNIYKPGTWTIGLSEPLVECYSRCQSKRGAGGPY